MFERYTPVAASVPRLLWVAAPLGLVASLPFSGVVRPLDAFKGIDGAIVLLGFGFTGVFALMHFRASRLAVHAVIGAAYLFCLPLLVANLLFFPGVIPAIPSSVATAATGSLSALAFGAFGLSALFYAQMRRRIAAALSVFRLGLSAIGAALMCVAAVWVVAQREPIRVSSGFHTIGLPLLVLVLAGATTRLAILPRKTRLDEWFLTAQFLIFVSAVAALGSRGLYSIPWYYAWICASIGSWSVLWHFIEGSYASYERLIFSLDELAERAEDEQSRFEQTINNAAIGIAHLDRDGKILFANDHLCMLLGRPPGVLAREPTFFALLDGSSVALPADGSERSIEAKCRHVDGTDRWLEIWLTKGPSEGSDAPYYIAVVSDITAAKAAQAAMLQLNDIKSQFIATMGREIRAPLHEIVGVSELFKRTAPLTEKQRRFAETIDASAQTLVHLVDDILEFSKIEAAKLQIEPSPFDLVQLLESIREAFAAQAERKDVKLIARVAPSLAGRLYGDAGRLRQILDNLVSNAVKFTDTGQVVLEAHEIESNGSRVLVRFRVEDTGIGIPTHAQTRIFDAFWQVDASTTRRHGGTGLGLTIVQRLVELMGGLVRLESRPGSGSTFWFDIWLERDAGEGAGLASDPALSGRPIPGARPAALEDSSSAPISSGDGTTAIVAVRSERAPS